MKLVERIAHQIAYDLRGTCNGYPVLVNQGLSAGERSEANPLILKGFLLRPPTGLTSEII